jgi:hypothetical protein
MKVLMVIGIIVGLPHIVVNKQPIFKKTPFVSTPKIINQPKLEPLVSALIYVESRGIDSAYCKSEDAVGCLQIRPIMVKEINRILKIQKNPQRYELKDRWDRKKSLEMFYIWKDFHHPNSTNERIARNWNGGPKGYQKQSTLKYWKKIERQLN